MSRKKMVIVSNYSFEKDNYGLLGPQLAATVIQDNTEYDCIVLALGRTYDKELVKSSILKVSESIETVIGFSQLGERIDLWNLAKELKELGATTILGGPQADVDYIGEVGWQRHGHRFQGLSEHFTFAIHGPVEQIIPFLKGEQTEYQKLSGSVCLVNNLYCINPRNKWDEKYLKRVNWNNLFHITERGIEKLGVTNVQVLQQIGCPYASKNISVEIDYPSNIHNEPFLKKGRIGIQCSGCSFCDVARDKGFSVKLTMETVLAQIMNIPDSADGRKIPFELINENPFPGMVELLSSLENEHIKISQINLVTRADWLDRGDDHLREALKMAKKTNVKLLMSGIGFESFSNTILKNLNKGYTVETNIDAIKLLRQLKKEFPDNFLYEARDGAIHGFIHPTPWDTADTK
ncbi:MAG: hypothetical protein NTV30_04980 [Chloroflexi bacterium]|nr:hypothetical protein [Chloroflexota bacterium]